MNIAVIFAGGVGKRLNPDERAVPKQFLRIRSKPIIVHTLLAFAEHPQIDRIYVAILPACRERLLGMIRRYRVGKVAAVVDGGATGQDSIYNALVRAAQDCPADSVVLIHDGVRPIITTDVITRNIESVRAHGSAITCTPCYETIMVSRDGMSLDNVPFRRETFAGQAPQSFLLGDILAAHEEIRSRPERYRDIVDSCTLMRVLGHDLHLVPGNFGNIKVTVPEDLYILRALLKFIDDRKTEKGRKP